MLDAAGRRVRDLRRRADAGSPLHVDHDHETGAVRGISVLHCNNALGQFRDASSCSPRASSYVDAATRPTVANGARELDAIASGAGRGELAEDAR